MRAFVCKPKKIESSRRAGPLVKNTDRKYANTISRSSVRMDGEESLDGMKSSATILSFNWDGDLGKKSLDKVFTIRR